jgi:predicted CopG family antitoxin
MVTKTITITENAYEAVKRLKKTDESFSDLFLRMGKKATIRDLVGVLKMNRAEGNAFQKRVKVVRRDLNEGFERGIKDVRTRLQRNH